MNVQTNSPIPIPPDRKIREHETDFPVHSHLPRLAQELHALPLQKLEQEFADEQHLLLIPEEVVPVAPLRTANRSS